MSRFNPNWPHLQHKLRNRNISFHPIQMQISLHLSTNPNKKPGTINNLHNTQKKGTISTAKNSQRHNNSSQPTLHSKTHNFPPTQTHNDTCKNTIRKNSKKSNNRHNPWESITVTVSNIKDPTTSIVSNPQTTTQSHTREIEER